MAKAETIDTPAPTPARRPILPAARFGQPGQFRADWCATIPNDIDWSAINSPDFWRLSTHRIRIGDVIEVRRDDLTRWALFLCNFVEPSTGALNLVPLIEREFSPAEFSGDATGAFYPKHLGLTDGWGVIRAEDGHVMAKNIRSQQEARSRIAQEFAKPARPTFG